MNSIRTILTIQSLTQNQKLLIILSAMLGLKGDKNAHKDKARSQGQKKLQRLQKVQYRHLDCWCNKSTLHQMFLN